MKKSRDIKTIAIIGSGLNCGGAERSIGYLSKLLDNIYERIYLFLYTTEEIVYEYGGEIIDLTEENKDGDWIETLKRLKQKYDIDVTISFVEPNNSRNVLSRCNDRVIISQRGAESGFDRVGMRYLCRWECMNRYYPYADAIVVNSAGVKFDLMDRTGIVEKDIDVIPNFVNISAIRQKGKAPLAEAVLNWLGESGYFVHVGRLSIEKNQERLLHQFAFFRKNYRQDIKLIIIGSGSDEEKVKKLIEALDVKDAVLLLPYMDNPFPHIAHAKAFILSSIFEGMPNVVLEAMALSVPVIATDCLSGPRELLKGEIDYSIELSDIEVCDRGILVSNRKSEDTVETTYMAEAMSYVCDHPEDCQKMIQSVREWADAYKEDEILQQWIDVIEKGERQKSDNPYIEERKQFAKATHRYIFGAGKIGSRLYKKIRDRFAIDGFLVSNVAGQPMEVHGVPVIGIDQMTFEEEDKVIIGVGSRYEDEVLELLKNKTDAGNILLSIRV